MKRKGKKFQKQGDNLRDQTQGIHHFPWICFGEWGKDCTLQWVSEQIQNQIDEEGNDANITEDEINMSRGCERKVHL